HIGDPRALSRGVDHGQRAVVVRAVALGQADQLFGDHLISRVQHFGPPPALRSSLRSTEITSKPRRSSSRMSPVASALITTCLPSLTALRPSTCASSAEAMTASGNMYSSTRRLPSEKAPG